MVDDLSWGWLGSSADFYQAQSPCYGFTNVVWPEWVSSAIYASHPLCTSTLVRTCYHVLYLGRDMRAGLIMQALFTYLLISCLLTYCPKYVTGLSPKPEAIGGVWVFSTAHGKGLRIKTRKRSFGFFFFFPQLKDICGTSIQKTDIYKF